jgi:branched-chain amino acid transport system permease protein
MKDSPAACATLGINLTFTKLAVFALSASLAGVGGAFYGGLRGSVGPIDFEVLQSGALLLVVTISGINTVTGALAGGLTFGFFPRLQHYFPRSVPSCAERCSASGGPTTSLPTPAPNPRSRRG